MKVTIFGSGYVGLVQAAVLADVGNDVLCVDIDENKVANLKRGVIPIYEPGLSPLIKDNVEAGRLAFTTDAWQGVEHSNVIFIAVGTPPDEDGSADLRYVLDVAATVATHMTRYKLVVNKSTVPVGTADKVRLRMESVLETRGETLSFDVASNPEFLKEGAAVSDCSRPDRIIIGTDSPQVEARLRELYAPFNRSHDRVMAMDVRSAELTKYAANCILATKISFMNEMANLAEELGADIENVRRGIGSDPRIGYHFIYPGCGYGGSCFPKDVEALVQTARKTGKPSKLLEAVQDVNDRQKNKLFQYLEKAFGGELKGRTVALWGLAFKPNTDDMREASSRVLIEALWQAGAKVQAFDPEAMDECQRIYGHRDDLKLAGTKEAALYGADALVICTEWNAFRSPDFEFIGESLTHPVIVDGRNLFEPETIKDKGFVYFAIGRGDSVNRLTTGRV